MAAQMQPDLLEDLMLIEAMNAQGEGGMPGGMEDIDEIDENENIVEVNFNPIPDPRNEREGRILDQGEEGDDDEEDDDDDDDNISVCYFFQLSLAAGVLKPGLGHAQGITEYHWKIFWSKCRCFNDLFR
jgi:hypothetical protein